MKTLISIFSCCLFLSFLNGQIYLPTEAKTYQSLVDEVYTLSIFVDTDEDYWSSEEIDHFYEELRKSQEWIANQASNYEQKLEFINDHFAENKQVVQLSEVRFLKDLNKTQKQIFNELGYDDFQNFLDRNDFDFKTKRLKLLVFVKSRNRSHAYNQWSNTKLDVAFIYCQKTFGALTDQYVISHEMLHQFGAWDLYYGESQTQEQADRAKSLYPRSIMISTSLRRNLLQIDSLTAWRIGWHNDLKHEFGSFYPQRKNRTDLKNRNRREHKSSRIQFDLKEVKQRRKERKEKFGYQEKIYTSWNINPSLNISTHDDAKVVYARSGRWRIGRVFTDKLSIETGIDINRVGYRIQNVVDSIYIGHSNFGASTLLKNVPVKLHIREKFRSFPLQANYKILQKKHFEVDAYFNVTVNFYRFTYTDGLYYFQALREFRHNSVNSYSSKEGSTISYEIGGIIRKKLFGRFSMIGGANYQQLFLEKESSNAIRKFQYYKLGVMLGLRYELKRIRFEKL